jgi:hypothetical protein
MQEEIDFLEAVIRKNKILTSDGPYGQKQHDYSDPLIKALKIIDDQKSRIIQLEELISEKD